MFFISLTIPIINLFLIRMNSSIIHVSSQSSSDIINQFFDCRNIYTTFRSFSSNILIQFFSNCLHSSQKIRISHFIIKSFFLTRSHVNRSIFDMSREIYRRFSTRYIFYFLINKFKDICKINMVWIINIRIHIIIRIQTHPFTKSLIIILNHRINITRINPKIIIFWITRSSICYGNTFIQMNAFPCRHGSIISIISSCTTIFIISSGEDILTD